MSTKYSITTVFSSFMYGIVAIPVQIEVYLTPGINTFDILGLCDSSIMESRGRIRAALVASGYSFPHGHITISISPSYIKKAGTNFDLPIAIGILIASKQVRINCSKKLYAEGELSLDGQIKATPGGALRLSCAKKENYDFYYLPTDQKPSCKCASLSCSLNETLLDCIESMKRKYCPIKYSLDTVEEDDENYDVSIIKGQPKALRTLFISACGWHNVLLVGSPGCGKTMAGRLIKLLLPPLSNDEVCEIFALNNAISRTLESEDSISASRPFRYVIQDTTTSILIGSNSKLKPGEVVLANRGVLFADELCEYKKGVIDCLRQPMEDRLITFNKDGNEYKFPTNFIFVGSTNPCNCGNYYEKKSKCTCTEAQRLRYEQKISGPFLDRIDLFCEMHRVDNDGLKQIAFTKTDGEIRFLKEKVAQCWLVQKERARQAGIEECLNGQMVEENLVEIFRADKRIIEYCADMSTLYSCSARGFLRLLKIGRTIADIEGHKDIEQSDIAEAFSYRNREFGVGKY